jgi:hypothetical protein
MFMKKLISWAIAMVLFIPVNSFAFPKGHSKGNIPAAPQTQQNIDWPAFEKHQNDELKIFLNQLRAEKDGYLKAHPDVASKLRLQNQAVLEFIKSKHSKKSLKSEKMGR